MGRRLDRTVAAMHGVLVAGERGVAHGVCWAAQLGRVPLLFAGRRRYLLVLTDRRLLLFARRGDQAPQPNELLIGKRYDWFTLVRVRRARPVLQVTVKTGTGTTMVFEFPPRQRELGRALVTHLGPAEPPAALLAGPAVDPADEVRAADTVFWGPSTPSS